LTAAQKRKGRRNARPPFEMATSNAASAVTPV
jgi:hypothetical protein